jgi:hypothetical protein
LNRAPGASAGDYVEITNISTWPWDMTGWKLQSTKSGIGFTFPKFTILPGQGVRVYSNEVHPESGGFSFQSQQPVWPNQGDVATLTDAKGAKVAELTY